MESNRDESIKIDSNEDDSTKDASVAEDIQVDSNVDNSIQVNCSGNGSAIDASETEVIPVECFGVLGSLHKSKFTSGTTSPCIHVSEGGSWLTPQDFQNYARKRVNTKKGKSPWSLVIFATSGPRRRKLKELLDEGVIGPMHKAPWCKCELCSPNDTSADRTPQYAKKKAKTVDGNLVPREALQRESKKNVTPWKEEKKKKTIKVIEKLQNLTSKEADLLLGALKKHGVLNYDEVFAEVRGKIPGFPTVEALKTALQGGLRYSVDAHCRFRSLGMKQGDNSVDEGHLEGWLMRTEEVQYRLGCVSPWPEVLKAVSQALPPSAEDSQKPDYRRMYEYLVDCMSGLPPKDLGPREAEEMLQTMNRFNRFMEHLPPQFLQACQDFTRQIDIPALIADVRAKDCKAGPPANSEQESRASDHKIPLGMNPFGVPEELLEYDPSFASTTEMTGRLSKTKPISSEEVESPEDDDTTSTVSSNTMEN